MPNQITFAATITPATAAMEVCTNGTTFTAATFTTVGSNQQYTMTGVVAGTYAIGQLGLGAVGYSGTRLFNTVAVTVSATGASVSNATFTAA